MTDQEVVYSIAVPVFNEVEILPTLYERVCQVMDALEEPWEFILVDDGSSDGSTEQILDAYRSGQLYQPEYALPGYWEGARRCFRRHRGRRGRKW